MDFVLIRIYVLHCWVRLRRDVVLNPSSFRLSAQKIAILQCFCDSIHRHRYTASKSHLCHIHYAVQTGLQKKEKKEKRKRKRKRKYPKGITIRPNRYIELCFHERKPNTELRINTSSWSILIVGIFSRSIVLRVRAEVNHVLRVSSNNVH